ncbi:hypothetical protein [Aurantivibrio plasticivorans]
MRHLSKTWLQVIILSPFFFDLNSFNNNNTQKASHGVVIEPPKIIHRHIVTNNNFIGHVGREVFVDLFKSEDQETYCQQPIIDFNRVVVIFYTMGEIKRGGINAIASMTSEAMTNVIFSR